MVNELIVNITSALDKLEIPYMIIGGQAVLMYGEPRLTKDIDITLGISHERLADIIKLSEKLSFSSLADNIESFVNRTMVFPLEDKKSGLRVDFIFSFTEYEREAIKRAVNIMLGNSAVKFASVEDVIIHKIFAGRPRDIEDIKGIIYKNKNFDKSYVLKWLKLFDETDNKNKLLDMFNSILVDLEF